MVVLSLPTDKQRREIQSSLISDLNSYTHRDAKGVLRPAMCCVCDSQPTAPEWAEWIPVNELASLCDHAKMNKKHLRDVCSTNMLKCCTAKHENLSEYVLLPEAQLNSDGDSIHICKHCACQLRENARKDRRQKRPPILSVANGCSVGDPPQALEDLNPVELSLLSRVRICSQTWVFFGGCHKQIKGWHTFFRNRHLSNVGNLNLLAGGMHGNIVAVLCGPFTDTQAAIAREAVTVRQEKVVAAFKWLKKNNHHCKNDETPNEDELPVPLIIEHDKCVTPLFQTCSDVLPHNLIFSSTGHLPRVKML